MKSLESSQKVVQLIFRANKNSDYKMNWTIGHDFDISSIFIGVSFDTMRSGYLSCCFVGFGKVDTQYLKGGIT